MKQVSRSAVRSRHITGRLSAVPLVVGGWLVLTAAMAAAKVAPDDPSSAAANPVIGTDSVPWTRYLLVAVIACLVGAVATLVIGFVVNRRRRISMAHA